MSIDPLNLGATAIQTFADDFGALSLWDGTKGTWLTTYPWADELGNGSTLNDEQEWYINSRYAKTAAVKPWTVSSSILTITADKAPPAIKPLINGYAYTSGQLNTFKSFNQTYGYFEIRCILPKGQGFWPAFWMDRQDLVWPPEIDIFEVLGKETTKLYTTVHTQQGGTHTSASAATVVPDMSAAFHTYGVNWQSDFTVFYFDRAEIFRTPTPSDMHGPMFLMLNLGLGGAWGGPVDATTPFPAKYLIDYVRAYKSRDGSILAPPSAPLPPPQPSGSGVILRAPDKVDGETLVGTPGDDVFYAGHYSTIMTGNGGSNRYVFPYGPLPWSTSRITDFRVGVDRLDFSAMPDALNRAALGDDGSGGTRVYYKDAANQWPTSMVVLEKVLPATLTLAALFGGSTQTSAFGTALSAFMSQWTTTPSAEKIRELQAQITQLGG